jgi:hypothetical protein
VLNTDPVSQQRMRGLRDPWSPLRAGTVVDA